MLIKALSQCLPAWLMLATCAQVAAQPAPAIANNGLASLGIVFQCPARSVPAVRAQMDAYLASLSIDAAMLAIEQDTAAGKLVYRLREAVASPNTLTLSSQPHFDVRDERVVLSAAKGQRNTVSTVSKKEIVLAMLQPGQATVLAGAACDVGVLKDHVGIRQNTVAWAESLSWVWPNGGHARWNRRYWKRGVRVKGHPLHEAVADAFLHQSEYAIGCYTAAKLVMIQGVLDYFHRIKRDARMLHRVEALLLADGEPLSGIEPGVMWRFESDFTEADAQRSGKLLGIAQGVPGLHFIPGDWSYFLNTDAATYEKTGYEGSNAIYLGRGRFDDFYDDHRHHYTYEEKLNEVYQWRNHVFSASRDAAKVVPLRPIDFERLRETPDHGGIVLDARVAPLLFTDAPESIKEAIGSVVP